MAAAAAAGPAEEGLLGAAGRMAARRPARARPRRAHRRHRARARAVPAGGGRRPAARARRGGRPRQADLGADPVRAVAPDVRRRGGRAVRAVRGRLAPVRIVLAVGTLRVGGTETQLVKLAAGLIERGHDVHVLALSGGGPLEAPLLSAGATVRIFRFAARV